LVVLTKKRLEGPWRIFKLISLHVRDDGTVQRMLFLWDSHSNLSELTLRTKLLITWPVSTYDVILKTCNDEISTESQLLRSEPLSRSTDHFSDIVYKIF